MKRLAEGDLAIHPLPDQAKQLFPIRMQLGAIHQVGEVVELGSVARGVVRGRRGARLIEQGGDVGVEFPDHGVALDGAVAAVLQIDTNVAAAEHAVPPDGHVRRGRAPDGAAVDTVHLIEFDQKVFGFGRLTFERFWFTTFRRRYPNQK